MKARPQQEIETANRDESGRFVERLTERNFHQLALLEQALFHEVAEGDGSCCASL